jgi:hypothetical protein
VVEPRLEDVFKISGVPTHTFVEPSEFPALKVSLRSPGRGVVVEGPSGIGKSTAVTSALRSLGIDRDVTPLSARRPGDVGYIELIPEMTDFGVVIIDDFHVLDDDIRGRIADLLKTLADSEDPNSKLIIIGINRAGESLIKHAPDLANRVDTIRFEVEPAEKVDELIRAGETALNITLGARDRIVEGAQGSFYLAQLLGHAVCTEAGVTEAQESPGAIDTPYNQVRRKVMERQERRFGDPIMKFVRGTHFRPGGRANYLHILTWLKDAESWSIVLPEEMARHPAEKAGVAQVVEKGHLENLTSIQEIAAILHFDPATRILSVEDPQLVFYLRNLDWPDFVRRTGFTRVEVQDEYDFALSFAGEDRPFAERLHERLTSLGHSVFYDFAEQHRILAEDLEEFLGPIYESKATYVIAVLGREFGRRRWTRFESDRFKARFGEGRVIPVWSTEAPPTAFDKTQDIGGIRYDPAGDLDQQAEEVAELCSRKISEPDGQTSLLDESGSAS